MNENSPHARYTARAKPGPRIGQKASSHQLEEKVKHCVVDKLTGECADSE